MSLVGSQMGMDHSLTHSILINLFIKQFPPTSPTKYCVCPRVFSRLKEGLTRGRETREAYIFVESLGKSLSSASKIEVGHYGFHVVLFRKYVVF